MTCLRDFLPQTPFFASRLMEAAVHLFQFAGIAARVGSRQHVAKRDMRLPLTDGQARRKAFAAFVDGRDEQVAPLHAPRFTQRDDADLAPALQRIPQKPHDHGFPPPSAYSSGRFIV